MLTSASCLFLLQAVYRLLRWKKVNALLLSSQLVRYGSHRQETEPVSRYLVQRPNGEEFEIELSGYDSHELTVRVHPSKPEAVLVFSGGRMLAYLFATMWLITVSALTLDSIIYFLSHLS